MVAKNWLPLWQNHWMAYVAMLLIALLSIATYFIVFRTLILKYYYYREQAVENILKAGITRGEIIEEINRCITEELAGIDAEQDFDHAIKVFEKWVAKRESLYMVNESGHPRVNEFTFDIYSPDEGGYAGVALKYIEIIQSEKPGSMILCAPNRGAIPGPRDDDVVEVTCDITPEGVHPRKIDESTVHPGNLELVRRVKYYERLAACGIVNSDPRDIVECPTMHPLVNPPSSPICPPARRNKEFWQPRAWAAREATGRSGAPREMWFILGNDLGSDMRCWVSVSGDGCPAPACLSGRDMLPNSNNLCPNAGKGRVCAM